MLVDHGYIATICRVSACLQRGLYQNLRQFLLTQYYPPSFIRQHEAFVRDEDRKASIAKTRRSS